MNKKIDRLKIQLFWKFGTELRLRETEGLLENAKEKTDLQLETEGPLLII